MCGDKHGREKTGLVASRFGVGIVVLMAEGGHLASMRGLQAAGAELAHADGPESRKSLVRRLAADAIREAKEGAAS